MKRPIEEIAVREARVFLKTVSEGLKVLAKGVENLAKQVESLTDTDVKQTAGAKKRAPKMPPKKAKGRASKRPATATAAVFDLISQSKTGITAGAISEKTGYDRRKIHNIVYRLKKQGKIRAAAKGLYVKA